MIHFFLNHSNWYLHVIYNIILSSLDFARDVQQVLQPCAWLLPIGSCTIFLFLSLGASAGRLFCSPTPSATVITPAFTLSPAVSAAPAASLDGICPSTSFLSLLCAFSLSYLNQEKDKGLMIYFHGPIKYSCTPQHCSLQSARRQPTVGTQTAHRQPSSSFSAAFSTPLHLTIPNTLYSQIFLNANKLLFFSLQ